MTELILGMLQQKKLTAYEIQAVIRSRYRNICTDSLGSIHAALKKLLDAGRVAFDEYVEKGLNKKRYSITLEGRKHFFKWLQTPIDVTAVNSSELGKLLQLGTLPEEKRIDVIDATIAKLKMELSALQEVHKYMESILDDEIKQLQESWKSDEEYFSHVADKAKDISLFKMMTLQYGIEVIKFNIKWFEELKEK